MQADLRREMAAMQAELRGEMRAIRAEFHEETQAMRAELRAEAQAIRALVQSEIQGIRGNGANLSLATLHAEIAALRGEGGEGLTLVGLRQEIRDGDEETRRLMRVLHEDLVERIARLGEQRAFGVAATPRKAPGGKKKSSRRR